MAPWWSISKWLEHFYAKQVWYLAFESNVPAAMYHSRSVRPLCFYLSSLFNHMLSPCTRRKCFFLGCIKSAAIRSVFVQGWEFSQGWFLDNAQQLLLHLRDSWMSQLRQASFHRGQRSCGTQPVGDSRVSTHRGLHLEGFSKDNRLWTELFFFFLTRMGRKGKKMGKPWNAYWSFWGQGGNFPGPFCISLNSAACYHVKFCVRLPSQ